MADNTVHFAAGARLTRFSDTAKRLNYSMKRVDERVTVRAQAAGIPAARLLARIGFVLAIVALLSGMLLIAFWIFIAIAPALIFALIIYAHAVTGLDGDTGEGSGPDFMGADLYAGDHDKNGHYIGHFKTTWLDE